MAHRAISKPNVDMATRTYPKRKRAEVSYCDDFTDATESDEYHSEIEEAPPSKKTKATKAAASTRPLPKKKIFPFFSLPPELRNKIYCYALTDSEPLFLVSRTRQYRHTAQIAAPIEMKDSRRRHRYWPYSSNPDPEKKSTFVPLLIPSLLALNHQIFDEAQPILYGSNVFALEDTTALHAFCANIGPKNCATLREIHIKAWGYTKSHKAMNHPAFTILGQAVNLERLYMDCQIHWGAPTHVAKQIFRDGHHWFEIMGQAKGRVDAAVDILDIGDKNLGGQYQHSDENGRSWVKSPDEDNKKEEFQKELRRLLKA